MFNNSSSSPMYLGSSPPMAMAGTMFTNSSRVCTSNSFPIVKSGTAFNKFVPLRLGSDPFMVTAGTTVNSSSSPQYLGSSPPVMVNGNMPTAQGWNGYPELKQ